MYKEWYATKKSRSWNYEVTFSVTSVMTFGFSVSAGTRYVSVGLNLLWIHFDACVWKRDHEDNKQYWA